MRWKLKDNPIVGDVRFVTKFAFLPTEVESKLDGKSYIVWLQLYLAKQVYTFERGWFNGLEYGWETTDKTIHT